LKEATVTLREYRSGDIEPMYALDVLCFEKPFRFTRAAMRKFAEARNARVLIAEDAEAMVGFAILQIEKTRDGLLGYVVTLDVAPEHRRRGVAGSVMHEIERLSQAENCVALVLHVFVGNAAALRFYDAAGFARSQRVMGFYGPNFDAWIYQKLLPGAKQQGT
jgi:ribosomal-protein-alanine N-acetyltransferase